MATIALLLLLAQTERIKCTTIGETKLGQSPTTVPLRCCPQSFYIADPAHPVDSRGNLVCVRET